MIQSDNDFDPNDETCSNMRLTIDGASIDEATPTLDAFVEFLNTFGQATHSNSAKMYYKFPNTVIASVYFIPAEPLKETMEKMISSLEAPQPFPPDKQSFDWDERESGQRIKRFPLISWISIDFPSATCND